MVHAARDLGRSRAECLLRETRPVGLVVGRHDDPLLERGAALAGIAGAVREGRLRAVALTTLEPAEGDFAGVPPLANTIPGFEIVGWQGIGVPKDTPRDIVLRLNEAFNKVLAEDEVKEFIRKGNLKLEGGTPEKFADKIKRDYAFYGKVAKDNKIEPQ